MTLGTGLYFSYRFVRTEVAAFALADETGGLSLLAGVVVGQGELAAAGSNLYVSHLLLKRAFNY